jgi:flagellar biosynthesis regulator FlbT
MLSEEGKRAALIISMQGGERITFELDSPGGNEYKKMLKWLTDVSMHDVIEPELTTTPKKEIQFDVDKAIREFNDALQAALDMFDSGSKSLKKFILLTAGRV